MNQPDLKILGETIKSQREEMCFTLREFSNLTGVSFSQLSKIERGEHRPTRETLEKIASHISVQKGWLYLMAGYSDYVVSTLENNPLNDQFDMKEDSITNIPIHGTVHEPKVNDLSNDWTSFIDKMESRKLSPKEIESIIADYEKIKAILIR
ncbi:helix-turn-helix domain-containing protein [Bacillus andreraoultii]|uniref:helix-turn-helix domain-containing protein n=1 Tax=Bacillus andreraoultii TaxID=1499685 RepID=UPI00067E8801|nr:helix-turn-helix transcriptional regulator [Bacillus andreraoultii]